MINCNRNEDGNENRSHKTWIGLGAGINANNQNTTCFDKIMSVYKLISNT